MRAVGAGPRPDGTYTLSGLPTGDYRVQADASHQGLTRQFYTSTLDWELAARVSVTTTETTPNIDFILSSGGSITGLVTDEATGQPLSGVDVWADTFLCCGGGNGARTELDGTYTISGLAPGEYRVRAEKHESSYVGEFYASTTAWDQATPVTVVSDSTTPNIDFSLTSGGAISGTVTNEATGQPVANADVWADLYDCCGGAGGWTRTEADGTYIIDGLPGGTFRVTAQAPDQGFVREFYASTTEWHLATEVAVTAGATTAGIDFSLVGGGSISGRVTRESDGSPIPEADVWADTYDCCGGGNGARTDADGYYTIDGLAAGNYRVQVHADEQGLVGEFYASTTNWEQATSVGVTAGVDTPNIDFTLAGGGSISGHVFEADGVTPIADAGVFAFGPNGWGDARTDGNGEYRIDGLSTGSYRVEAEGIERGFVREFYNGTTDFEAATLVAVTAGVDVPNIDFALDQGGSISGTVYHPDGVTPLAEADIHAFSDTGRSGGHTRSGPDGTYIIEGLPTGSFRVQAEAHEFGFARQFYSSTASFMDATLVAVTVGSDTPGIDFIMEAGGTISGTVVTANPGAPIAGVEVWANPYDGDGFGGGAITDENGYYEITGLAPGDYRVRAQRPDGGLAGEWYNDTTDWGLAERVPVLAGQATENIDFDLGGGGSISGTVYMSDGTTPLAGADVWANLYDCCGGGNGALTAADGTFTIDGLAAADYRVRAQKEGYTFEYYLSTTSHFSSTRVTVVQGGDTPNTDFTLDLAGTISGVVTDQVTGQPIANAFVSANTYDCCGEGNGTQTDANGSYVIDSLPSGTYRVSARKDGYVREFWQNTSNFESSTPVVVTAPNDTGGIDFALEVGGSISGVVTEVDGVTPISNAFVRAENLGGGGGSRTLALADGTYTIDGLATGSYRVVAEKDGYVEEFWQETSLYESSTPVVVTPPGDTGGINFTLETGGSISGVVTDQATGQPIPNAFVNAFLDHASGGGGTMTAPDGNYTIDGLLPASYIVRAQAPGFVRELWQEVLRFSSSTPVAVTVGANVGGIDFTLVPGGSVSGVVKAAAGGAPIDHARVFLFDSALGWPPPGEPAFFVETENDGTYFVDGVLPGSYTVLVDATQQDYILQFWDHETNPASSTAVVVTVSVESSGIDFDLALGGSISGTVTAAVGGAPLEGIEVEAEVLATGQVASFTESKPDGSYHIGGLPAGTYVIIAIDDDMVYAEEYYDGAADPGSATPIPITGAGDHKVEFDFTLELAP